MFITKKNDSYIFGILLTSLFLIGIANSNLAIAKTSKLLFTIQQTQSTRTDDLLFVRNNFAYTPNSTGFTIYNLTKVTHPEILIHHSFGGYSGEVSNFFVDDSNVYLSDFNKKIFMADCSNIANIQSKTMQFDDIIKQILVDDNTLYVLHSKNFTIYNIANPIPSIIGNIALNLTDLDHFLLHKNFVYCFDNTEGIMGIVNITNTANPFFFGNKTDDFGSQKIAHFGDYLFQINSEDIIRIVNISAPFNPQNITDFNNPKALLPIQDVSYYNEHIFVLYSNGFDIFDAANLSDISLLAQYRLKSSSNINFSSLQVKDNFVLIRNYSNESLLYIFSFSVLSHIEQVWPRVSNANPVAAAVIITFSILIILISLVVVVALIITKKT